MIIFGGVLNSVIAIWQFATQKSLGLFWLKESLLSPNIDGVAKIVINGHKMIRSYGLLPHSNVLGGFLVLSIILTIFYKKMFYSSSDVPPQYKCSTWNILRSRRGTSYEEKAGHSNQDSYNCHSALESEAISGDTALINISRIESGMTVLFIALLIIQTVALILTFSKSAIVGLMLGLVYIYVPRGTFYSTPVKKFLGLAFAIIIFSSLIISTFPSISPISIQSLDQRTLFSNVSRGTIVGHALFGIGTGEFVWSMKDLNIEYWQFQPVHNVFLLIWSELGIIGLIILVSILWKTFHPSINVPRGTSCGAVAEHSKSYSFLKGGLLEIQWVFKGVLLGFIFIMLFDHYFWDIQQGQLMLWMILGFVAGLKSNSSDTISL